MKKTDNFRAPETIEKVFLIFAAVTYVLIVVVIQTGYAIGSFGRQVITICVGVSVLCILAETILQRVQHQIVALSIHLISVLLAMQYVSGVSVAIELTLVLALLFAIALHLRFFHAVIAMAISLGATASVAFGNSSDTLNRITLLLAETGVGALTLLAVEYRERIVVVSKKVETQRKSLENLAAANHSFVAHLENVAAESEERERLRITRELHDSIGYAMTTLSMMMKASHFLIEEDPVKLLEYCDRTEEIAANTLRETREILYKMRAIGRESRPALSVFFNHLCKDFADATGVQTECFTNNAPRIVADTVFAVLFRSVQVGLINALRHGHARHIRLFLTCTEENIVLSIRNDTLSGIVKSPLPGVSEGIGLHGVRERLDMIGGQLDLRALTDGFEMLVEIPNVEADKRDDTSSNR